MDRHGLEPDTRVSIRAHTSDGIIEVVGWVLTVDTDGLRVRTRREDLSLRWNEVHSCRKIGVPRGTDPRRANPAQLDKLASLAGLKGQKFVARLSQLLDGRSPVRGDCHPAVINGQWAIIGDESELWAAAWASARADARSVLAVTNDPDRITELLAAGFSPAPHR